MSELGALHCRKLWETGCGWLPEVHIPPILAGTRVNMPLEVPLSVHQVSQDRQHELGVQFFDLCYPVRCLLGSIASSKANEKLREMRMYDTTLVDIGETIVRACIDSSKTQRIRTGKVNNFEFEIIAAEEVPRTALNVLRGRKHGGEEIIGVVMADIVQSSVAKLQRRHGIVRFSLYPDPPLHQFGVRIRAYKTGSTFSLPKETGM